MPFRSMRRNIASCEASLRAMYSAWHELSATVRCLRELHEITPVPKLKQYPPTDLLVWVQFA